MMHPQDALYQMSEEDLRRALRESVGDLLFLQGTAPVEFLGRRQTEYAAHLIKELCAENAMLRDALKKIASSADLFSEYDLADIARAALEGK